MGAICGSAHSKRLSGWRGRKEKRWRAKARRYADRYGRRKRKRGRDPDRAGQARITAREGGDDPDMAGTGVSCPCWQGRNGSGAHGELGLLGGAGRIKDGGIGGIRRQRDGGGGRFGDWRGGGGGYGCGHGGGTGKRGGFCQHSVPRLVFVYEGVFLFDARERVEHELADVGEDGGVAGWDAVLGQGGEEFAEDEVDVGGGHEITADGGGDLGTEALGFEELHFVAGVEEAKSGVAVVAEHAATASVGSLELAAVGIGKRSLCESFLVVVLGGCFLWHFHGRSSV